MEKKLLWFVVLSCIPLTLVADPRSDTLTYSYQGQVLTGVEGCNQVYSGILIECTANVQKVKTNQFLLQLNNIGIKKFIGPVEDSPNDIVTSDLWVELGGQKEESFRSQLSIVTVFDREDNNVSNIFSSESGEPVWSLNIKKGILSIFSYRTSPGIKEGFEVGIHGNCSSIYNIRASDKVGEDDITFINKVWDLQNCPDRSKKVHLYGLHGYQSKKYKETEMISSQSQAAFKVEKDKHWRTIPLTAEVNGVHEFRPFSRAGKSVMSYTSQKLTFVEKSEVATIDVDKKSNHAKSSDLKMELVETDPLAPSRATSAEQIEASVQEVDALLTNINDGFKSNGTDDSTTSEFILLIQKLRQITNEEVNEVIKRFGTKSADEEEIAKKRREILEDALVVASTFVSMSHIISKIKDGHITGERAAWMLTSLAYSRPENVTIVTNLLTLCYSKEEDAKLYGPCMLSFGSLVDAVCTSASPKEFEAASCPEKENQFIQALSGKVKSTKSDSLNKLFIKASGNAGNIRESQIPELLETVMGFSSSSDLITQTIYSFRKVLFKFPSTIQSSLLPVYLNTSLDSEIRMAACYMLMESHPSPLVMQAIASSLLEEKDPQVASFSYSHIKSIAKTHKSFATIAQNALDLIGDRVYPILQHSKSYSTQNIELGSKLRSGVTLNMMYALNHSLPIAANLKISTSILHYFLNIFEIGGRLDWPPVKTSVDPEMLSGTNPELDAINRQFGINPEKFIQDAPSLSVYLKSFRSEFRNLELNITSATLLKFMSILTSNRAPKMQKLLSLGEGDLTVCTDIGIPLSLNVSTAASVAISANLRGLSLTPQPTIGGSLSPRVSVMLESILSSHITSIIKSGVGIRMIANATLPIDGTLTIGQQGFKLHWNLTNPKQELLGLRSHPYAFLIRNERKPVGTPGGSALSKYEASELTSEKCQGSSVHEKITVIGKYEGVHLNISDSYIQDGRGIALSGPYEKKVVLESKSKEIHVNFTTMDTVMSVDELLKRMDPHTSRHDSDDFSDSSGSSSSSSSSSSSGSDSSSSSSHSSSSSSHSSSSSDSSSGSDSSHSDSSHSDSSNSRSFSGSDLKDLHEHVRHGLSETATGEENIPDQDRQNALVGVLWNYFFPAETVDETTGDAGVQGGRSFAGNSSRQPGEDSSSDHSSSDHSSSDHSSSDHSSKDHSSSDRSSSDGSSSDHSSSDHSFSDHILIGRSHSSSSFSSSLQSSSEAILAHHHKSTFKKILKAKQYLLNLTTVGDAPGQNHTTLMSLVTAFSEKFIKLWNLEIFPATDMARSMRKSPYRMLCAQSALELPDPNQNEDNPMIRAKLASQWGRSCEEDQKVMYKLKIENGLAAPGSAPAVLPLEQECELHKAERGVLSDECLAADEMEGDLKTGTLELSHNGIESRWKGGYYAALNLLKKVYSEHAQVDFIDVYNHPNKVLWKWSTLEKKNLMNLFIKNPHETVLFTRMPLPFDFPVYNYNHQLGFVNEKTYGKCRVTYNGQIITFDEAKFGYNLTSCYHLIAEDCSVSQNFSVLSRTDSTYGATAKDLLVYVKGTKVEVTRSSSGTKLEVHIEGTTYSNSSNEIVIFSNGTIMEKPKVKGGKSLLRLQKAKREWGSDFPSSSSSSDFTSAFSDALSFSRDVDRMTRREQKHFTTLTRNFTSKMTKTQEAPTDSVKIVAVITLGEEVALHSALVGLNLRFDGKNIIVQVSPKYHRHLCGTCGSFNGVGGKHDGFIGANKTVYDHGIQAAVSYQNLTDSCTPSGCNLHLATLAQDECTSISNWPQCTESCSSSTSVSQKMKMICTINERKLRRLKTNSIQTSCTP
ncbi:vitellogenin-5-like isoform X2 [Apostichopus japonicus]|uniref:vitellogenin-5-like isoform X2 n=1 Tax=Stichopus japonicus TaxID=307972 RepID=UPI003AB83E11